MLRACAILLIASAAISAQQPALVQPVPPPEPPPRKPAPIEKLGAKYYRVGSMLVDTSTREVDVPGTLNDITTVEFLANTLNGAKAYESAITLDTNAISFNAALLLIGLDPAHGSPAKRQFDRDPPKGDPVELLVAWEQGGQSRRVPVETLLYDQRTKKTVPPGPWVYTGSTFVDVGDGKQFLAEIDGVLIGLMHGPQAIIDNPRNDAVDGFGAIVRNPDIGVPAGTAVRVTVRALAASPK